MKVKPRVLPQRAPLGQVNDMDIRLLRVFKSVVECRGMAAAELELNIGISTVSRHVKDLETRLGLTLCRRGRAGFSLTEEGQRVYAETLRLLESVDVFKSSVDDLHRRLGGELNVAVFDKTAGNPDARISEAIARFVETAPDVHLNLHVAHINAIERGVLEGKFHVGIIPGHRESNTLRYDRLFAETMLLYCGADHPLRRGRRASLGWDDLHAYAFAGLGYHSPNMDLTQDRRLARTATGFDQEAIATLILSGKFLGFLPDHYAAPFVQAGQMVSVHPTVLRYDCEFFSISRRSPAPSRVAQLFLGCLREVHAH